MALVTEAKFVDYLKIAVIAWLAVKVGDMVLSKLGLSQLQATPGSPPAASNS